MIYSPIPNNHSALQWYRSLTPIQKMWLKQNTELICGIAWSRFGALFTPRERINIIYEKINIEFGYEYTRKDQKGDRGVI